MTPSRRQVLLVGITLALLALVSIWSVDWMKQQRTAAQLSTTDLHEASNLARTIQTLRKQPTIATDRNMGAGELGERIEQASRESNLELSSLESVQPRNPRRVDDSPYLHQPTVLRFRDLTLRQLVGFLHHLTDQSGLHVQSLRLMSPPGAPSDDHWDAEATLIELIYKPLSSG